MAPFLTELRVRGFACLKDVHCTPTPLHAFIGPNDSGKSTLLRAIAQLTRLNLPADAALFAAFGDGSDLRFHLSADAPGFVPGFHAAHLPNLDRTTASRVMQGQASAQLVRLDADQLRRPSALIPHGQELQLTGRGDNLAGLYDALRDRSIERFAAISDKTAELFPSVKALGLRSLGSGTKVLTVTLRDGMEVPSEDMSEGLLYYLAIAILGELRRPDVYLVEEPENGLHPSRIRQVVAMLRAVTEGPTGAQVLVATHSPLVVNELRPEEVTVVTRDPHEGTLLRPITAAIDFEARSKVYALGELWLSYADGKKEEPLFAPGRR